MGEERADGDRRSKALMIASALREVAGQIEEDIENE